ncbi:hypothetical protein DL98DRAFT_542490 [Cadophora sp. DSE1049]|nr:hypothetical protein DL98DRAFT_542490 [Cadophora sp. DSE1049]
MSLSNGWIFTLRIEHSRGQVWQLTCRRCICNRYYKIVKTIPTVIKWLAADLQEAYTGKFRIPNTSVFAIPPCWVLCRLLYSYAIIIRILKQEGQELAGGFNRVQKPRSCGELEAGAEGQLIPDPYTIQMILRPSVFKVSKQSQGVLIHLVDGREGTGTRILKYKVITYLLEIGGII